MNALYRVHYDDNKSVNVSSLAVGMMYVARAKRSGWIEDIRTHEVLSRFVYDMTNDKTVYEGV